MSFMTKYAEYLTQQESSSDSERLRLRSRKQTCKSTHHVKGSWTRKKVLKCSAEALETDFLESNKLGIKSESSSNDDTMEEVEIIDHRRITESKSRISGSLDIVVDGLIVTNNATMATEASTSDDQLNRTEDSLLPPNMDNNDEPAEYGKGLSTPKPSNVIYIKSEPLLDYEYDDDDSNKKPRLELNNEDRKEDVTSVLIKEEFDPDQIFIKEELEGENENESEDHIDTLNDSELVIDIKNEITFTSSFEEKNENEMIVLDSHSTWNEFSGFSFNTYERRTEPYIVDSQSETTKQCKCVQTDVTSAFQQDQLITYHQLTEEKLLYFSGVSKHKFQILYNFLFCNSPSLSLKRLSNEDQLLLALFKYKHRSSKEYLSHLFGVSEKQVCHIMCCITKKFTTGLNDITLWSVKKNTCSLALIMECRDFITNSLKGYCPSKAIAQFF